MIFAERICTLLIAAATLLLVAGCGAPPTLPDAPDGAPAGFPASSYATASAGETVYEIDTARSLVQVLVYRGGALAKLGHDHVIAARDVTGFLRHTDLGGERFQMTGDLYLPLAAMTVDEPALREAAGFDTTPSAGDREGTRGNMLKSLDAATFPFAEVAFSTVPVDAGNIGNDVPIDVTFSLHGTVREIVVPVKLALSPDGMSATGSFRLAQSDFGIRPFSVLGGALAVQDNIELKFEIFSLDVSTGSD